MAKKSLNRIIRPATAEDKHLHADIRSKVLEEFPPALGSGQPDAPPGIPEQIRTAREARGLTWYALAHLAGLPSSNIVRDIETGRDVKLANVQAVATVLGLSTDMNNVKHHTDVRYVLYVHYTRKREEIIDDFQTHIDHLERLLSKETERSSGLLILFIDYGLGDLVKAIQMWFPPPQDQSEEDAKKYLRQGIPELDHAEDIRDKLRQIARVRGLEQRIRVLTPWDLVDIFKNISQNNILAHAVGDNEQLSYDAPRFIESIVRARLLGSGLPVFRVDYDVLLPNSTESFYSRYHYQLEAAIAGLNEALSEHRRHTRALSTIMSCDYERPPKDSQDVMAWSRGYAIRLQPALRVLGESEFQSIKEADLDEDSLWTAYAHRAFDSDMAQKFFDGTWEWGAPTHAVISGALLYMSESVVLNMPPFINLSVNVSWIDDHLRYSLHRELGDFCPYTVYNDLGQSPSVRLDYSQVIKCRTGFSNLPSYTIKTYLPTLILGAIFDSWISNDSLVKKRWAQLEDEEEDQWKQLRVGTNAGLLTKWIREVQEGKEPKSSDIGWRINELKAIAEKRLDLIQNTWSAIKLDNGEHSFVSAWAEDQLPQWVKDALEEPSWYSLNAYLESQSWQQSLNTLCKDAIAYLSWVAAWPRVLQVVRSLRQGRIPSDIDWYDT